MLAVSASLNGTLKEDPSPRHKNVTVRKEVVAPKPRIRKVHSPTTKAVISVMSFCMGALVAAIILVVVKLAG